MGEKTDRHESQPSQMDGISVPFLPGNSRGNRLQQREAILLWYDNGPHTDDCLVMAERLLRSLDEQSYPFDKDLSNT